MSALRLILVSLAYHWRVQLAVAGGVVAGTAVITGALLVGDSMQGSLRDLTLQRLGRIDEALVADRFFRAELAGELARQPVFGRDFADAVPAILLRTTLETPGRDPPILANRVNLVGCDKRFWDLFPGRKGELAGSSTPVGNALRGVPRNAEQPAASFRNATEGVPYRREPNSGRVPSSLPNDGQVVLNEPLARQLGVGAGDEVILRLPRQGAIPAESALGKKSGTVAAERVRVQAVIPAEGPGRFDLRPSQQPPRTAFVPLDWLQDRLKQPQRANVIFVAGRQPDRAAPAEAEASLAGLLRPTLTDFGIRVEKTDRGYINITSDRMILSPPAEAAIEQSLRGLSFQPALVYLAKTIECRGAKVPYSTIAAVDFAAGPPLGPLVDADGKPIGPLGPEEIVLNSWAADDLHARPGDTVVVNYFQPESLDGQVRLADPPARFRLKAIAALTGAADDRAFTPEVPGVTDQRSINDWSRPGRTPPFPFDASLVRSKDEQYWHQHRATPKAFVSLATGRKLWASRFGQTTSIRVAPGPQVAERDHAALAAAGPTATRRIGGPALASASLSHPTLTVERLRGRIAIDPATMGFVFQPVKRQGLAASAGTTPFGVLFLAFSFFVLASAVMLVALLFRLAIEGRAAQVGLLLAVGFGRRRVARMLLAEGLIVAALGGLAGVGLGVGYALLMLTGLQTWWLAAIVAPFLHLHWTWPSLLIGYASGVLVAGLVIVASVRWIGRIAPRRLLAGQTEVSCSEQKRGCPKRSTSVGNALCGVPRETAERRPSPLPERHRGRSLQVAWALLALAVGSGLAAMWMSQEMRAVAFFGAGAMVLAAGLILVRGRLRRGAVGSAVAVGGGGLLRLALRNAARSPGRSTLTVGLVAAASFLIVAVSAFRLDPSRQTPSLRSGNGGFALMAQSDQPIYQDLGDSAGRADLGFSDADSRTLSAAKVVSFRVRPGDDASCLNLYQPRQPRILGVPRKFIDRDGFVFSAHAPGTPPMAANPWLLLQQDLAADPSGIPVAPVVVDQTTADYALHLPLGGQLEIVDGSGRTVKLRIAGLLEDSIFQGDVLMDEQAFQRLFPQQSGYRLFLLETSPKSTPEIQRALERALGDYGLVAETTGQRLAALMAVENTYLSTFQALGGLGVLLGTLGLAAVQFRNVIERRRELAVMRAVGFRRAVLGRLVMLENSLLLLGGLGCGVLAALAAVLPHLLAGGASIPWRFLAGTLLLVLAVGLLAGLSAVRAAVRTPLLAALRNE
jgi:ABC-type antimicrobial peptide transport system permease subunit